MGLLFAPLKWFFGMSLLLLALILAAWIIDWVFVFKVWPEGMVKLQSILEQDLDRAARLGGSYGELPGVAAATANFLYALLFEATGIHGMGASFAQASPLSIPDTIVRNAYVANFEAIRVAMIGTQLFGVRLATLVTALPLLAVAYGAASVDGLAVRAIRRARGGRESASLYHRAKHLQVIVLVTSVAIGLLLPLSMDPWHIWVPAAVLVAVLAHLQWAYYKKHL
jgi:integrating conjugative element membrane protein (TIGR03747 family)